jgi:hypothetical protein
MDFMSKVINKYIIILNWCHEFCEDGNEVICVCVCVCVCDWSEILWVHVYSPRNGDNCLTFCVSDIHKVNTSSFIFILHMLSVF